MNGNPQQTPAVPKLRPVRPLLRPVAKPVSVGPVPKAVSLGGLGDHGVKKPESPAPMFAMLQPSVLPQAFFMQPRPPRGPPPAALLAAQRAAMAMEETAAALASSKDENGNAEGTPAENSEDTKVEEEPVLPQVDFWALLEAPAEEEVDSEEDADKGDKDAKHQENGENTEGHDAIVRSPVSDDLEDEQKDEAPGQVHGAGNSGETKNRSREKHEDDEDDSWGQWKPSKEVNGSAAANSNRKDVKADQEDSDDDDSWGAWGKRPTEAKRVEGQDDDGSWGKRGHGEKGTAPSAADEDDDAWGEWGRGASTGKESASTPYNIEGVASDSEADSDDAWGDWGAVPQGATRKSTKEADGDSWGQWEGPGKQADQTNGRASQTSYKDQRQDDEHRNKYWERKEERSGHEYHDHSVLPIREKIHDVVPVLCGRQRVCCVLGETGCGKSTQVPQIIMEEAAKAGRSVRILVTQPRRVAALNLARRVAGEIGERSPGESVGYRIGGENVPGEKIDYCTVGYILQLLMHRPKEFDKYTHVVLDEVHERSAESDMLCLIVKLLATHAKSHVRLVVMSATFQADLFSEYYKALDWGSPAQLHIKARCYPVEEYFIEDLKSKFGGKLRTAQAIDQRIREYFPADASRKLDPRHCEKFHSIVSDLLPCIAEKGTTILVFLPGISEITALWEEARSLEDKSFKIFPLHSMIPREEQEAVFEEPHPSVTNVVLATDIAESSITLPNVVAVIDIGLHRRIDHDGQKSMAALATKWISRAAATQRCGRAGRTRPGICLRLYTRQFFEKTMAAFEPPEAQSMALDRLYLQAKQMAEKLSNNLWGKCPQTAEAVLKEMVQPPSMDSINKARIFNAQLGTITAATEKAKITSLGRLCLHLPIELRLARLVWFGALFGSVSDAIVLASVLSSMDAFASPSMIFQRNEDKFIDALRAATSARLLFDGGHMSEPLMFRQLFLEWLVKFHASEWVWGTKERVTKARRKHTETFTRIFSLSRGRLEHVVSHVLDLSLRTIRCCDWRSKAYQQIKTFILGLGYTINDRGDLAGIDWDDWKPFSYKEIFGEDVGYLKGILAAAFSDHLLLGSYGGLPPIESKAPGETSKVRADQLVHQKALLKAMAERKLKPRQTAVFDDKEDKNLDEYLGFVLGDKPARSRVAVKSSAGSSLLVDMGAPEASRWHPLDSRPSGHMLDSSHMLVAEFSLLSQFEKNVRDLEKAKVPIRWSGRLPSIQHPCLLRWELMQQVLNSRGAHVRCEAICEKRNAMGYVGHAQELQPGKDMRRIAVFGVAASLRSGENISRTFPWGVTALAPGHIGFILATANTATAMWGLQRFGFTLAGALAILHRSVELPSGVIDKSQWHLVLDLRQALRDELKVAEEWWSDSGNKSETVVFDSAVEDKARTLWMSVSQKDASRVVVEDREDPTPGQLVQSTVALFADPPVDGPAAFWPLVAWSELEKRRTKIIEQRKMGGKRATEKREAGWAPPQVPAAKFARTEPAPAQPNDAAGGASSSTASRELNGRWVEIIAEGHMRQGTKTKITYEFGALGSRWLRLSNGHQIAKQFEGRAWKFCDPPPQAQQAQEAPGLHSQTSAAQGPKTPGVHSAAQGQKSPGMQTPRPHTTTQQTSAAQGPKTPGGWQGWDSKNSGSGLTFESTKQVTALSMGELCLQITAYRQSIFSNEEKLYVINLLQSAIKIKSAFSPSESFAALSGINTVTVVNPVANLGGRAWPAGTMAPTGLDAKQIQARSRLLELLAELYRRSPVMMLWPQNPGVPAATGYAMPGTKNPTYFPPSAPKVVPPKGAAAPAATATRPTSHFLPPREDLLKLSISQLKEMIKQIGLSAAGCFEKADLVDRLYSGPDDAIAKLAADVRGSSYTPGNKDAHAADKNEKDSAASAHAGDGSGPQVSHMDAAPRTPTEDAPPSPKSGAAPKTPTQDATPPKQTAGANSPDNNGPSAESNAAPTSGGTQLDDGARAAAALLARRKKQRTSNPKANNQPAATAANEQGQ